MLTQIFGLFPDSFRLVSLCAATALLPGLAGAAEAETSLHPALEDCLLPALSRIAYNPEVLKDMVPGGVGKSCACMADQQTANIRKLETWNLPPAWASTFGDDDAPDGQAYMRMWGASTGTSGLSTDTGLGLAMRFPVEGPDLVQLVYPGPNPDLVQEPLQLFEVQFYVNY